jgi:hypothetical protein
MPMPPAVVHGGALHGAAEALQEAVKDAPRESRAGLTIGRRGEPQARQMGQMTAGRVALQHLQEEYVDGGDRREPAIAPGGLADLTAHGQHSVGLQPRGPLAGEALQSRGDSRTHRMPPWTIGMLIPIHTGEAGRPPPSTRSRAIHQACCLTSCHSAQSHNVGLRALRFSLNLD